MPDTLAIGLQDVSKTYRLYPSKLALALDTFGLYRLWSARKTRIPERNALENINLTISRGERVGIIGRNGAGKTTLLRVISGIATPTKGSAEINGRVQAMMETGLGFHPDFSGLENIQASLMFNGLSEKEALSAIDDIIDFVELGDYLYQPLKTYSLGMQARLGFAVATAIKPEILVVDEVLGAGDAYFIGKCADRMKRLTHGGATLLLVSHAMQQIIQFCERTIWMDSGNIVMDGPTLDVVRHYEAHIRNIEEQLLAAKSALITVPEKVQGERGGENVVRWLGEPGLRIRSFSLNDAAGRRCHVVESGSTAALTVTFAAESAGNYDWLVAFNIYTLDGKQVLAEWCERKSATAAAGEMFRAELKWGCCQLGNGEYVASVGLYQKLDMHDPSTARYYELWDRCLHFRVYTAWPLDPSLLKLAGEWNFCV